MGPGNEATKMIGTDEYGNQYYEDFHTYCKNINFKIKDYTKRRWVEFSEAHRFTSLQATKIPPPWHGWLCNIYDEPPSVNIKILLRKKTLLSLIGDLPDPLHCV